MTDAPSLAPTAIADIPRTLQTIRDVKARAAVSSDSESESERKAMGRLTRILTSGEPLKSEVPRGYYLNIQV